MKSSNLKQLGENVKSQHSYWEALSPDERRIKVIQMCNAQLKATQKSTLRMLVIGFIFLVVGIFFWFWVFKMNISSSLGLAGGLILATIGFNVLYTNRINSYYKILSNNFNDDDVISYFREHESVNQKFLDRWNKSGKYIFFISLGIGAFLLFNPSTNAFVIVAVEFGLGLFLTGAFFVLSPVQKRKR